MGDEKKRKLQERMAALHQKYCRQLPEKYQEIEECWKEYQADLNKSASIETFYRLIHTLKGTAATFGFVKQADICFKVQKILLHVKESHSVLKQNDVQKIQMYLDELKANINAPAEDISG